MVDSKARAELRIALRRLVTGRMTNDEFDDLYGENWIDSKDAAVAEIAQFGYCLYSSDVGKYRLKGRHTVSAETRRFASRSILFLYTEEEYQWPRWPDEPVENWLLGTLILSIVIGGVFALGSHSMDELEMWPLVLVPLWIAIWIAYCIQNRQTSSQHLQFMEKIGDYHGCWPFRERHDLEKAKKAVQFFGCSSAA